MTTSDSDPVSLTAEAQAMASHAAKLHATADATDPGSPERLAAEEADLDAEQEWEAASAVTSRIEGFSGGEPAE